VGSAGGRTVRSSGRIERRSLADTLYQTIRDQIITWAIHPNEILVETRLADEYEVSKTPVREALALLSQDGLVEVIPRVGYRVTPISMQDVHEVFDLRVLLEGEAAGLAAQRASEAELAAVKSTHDAWARRLLEDDVSPEEYLRFHDAFHLRIAELSGNGRLAAFIARLLREGTRLRMGDPLMSIRGLTEEQQDSERIVRALVRRDAKTARKLLEDHVSGSKERVLTQIVQQGEGRGVELG
jgi:GntR family transcriptional regulator, rspAB operon transcriptional repressor